MFMKRSTPLVLAILDGWGLAPNSPHNAIANASTPSIDRLMAEYPWTPIEASGEAIGLTPGHQGSTEMGHLIISAGRNVLLPQMRVTAAIESEIVGELSAFADAIAHAKQTGTTLHLMGLLSNAGVHSYDALCHALIRAAAAAGLSKNQVAVHVFSDGRDTPSTSLPEHIERLQAVMTETGVGRIATLQGRYWAMDRDHNWDRVERAYNLLVHGRGRTADSIDDAIAQARAASETDEFIEPTVIDSDGVIGDGDAVINFNYRVDREIEITQALIEPDFSAFDRGPKLNIHYVATFPYYQDMNATTAFDRTETALANTLPDVLAENNLSQYRITETEKWAYVTKIFNGMREEAVAGETRELIPSDTIATFDLKPEMKAQEIADDIVEQVRAQKYDVIVTNICNADMVGHTGNYEATIRGIETVDAAIKKMSDAVLAAGGTLIITADHGNAEAMKHGDATPHTQHTTNKIPFVIVNDELKHRTLSAGGSLKDVAPTILEILQIEKPAEMTGESLLQ